MSYLKALEHLQFKLDEEHFFGIRDNDEKTNRYRDLLGPFLKKVQDEIEIERGRT